MSSGPSKVSHREEFLPLTFIPEEPKSPSLLRLLVQFFFGWIKWICCLLESNSCSLKGRDIKPMPQNAPSPSPEEARQKILQDILADSKDKVHPKIHPVPRNSSEGRRNYDTVKWNNIAFLGAELEFRKLKEYLLRADTHYIPQAEVEKIHAWHHFDQNNPSTNMVLSPTLSEILQILRDKFVHVPEHQAYVKFSSIPA